MIFFLIGLFFAWFKKGFSVNSNKEKRPHFAKSLDITKITEKQWKQSPCLMCLQQGNNSNSFPLLFKSEMW